MNAIKHNLSKLLLLPYFIAVTAMLVLDNGDKKLIPFIILSIVISIVIYKKTIIIKNTKSPFIWLLTLLCIYAVFSYYYHGASSREIRALIGATLFLIFFPFQDLNQKAIQWMVLIGSLAVCINSVYFNLYIGVPRYVGYINPIPYSTACALISIIAFSVLINSSSLKEKFIPTLAFLLSLPPIMLSQTRGIWLAFTLSIFIIIVAKCIKNPPSRKQLLFTFIFTVVSTATAALLFKDEINQRYDSTIYEIRKIQSNNYNTSFGLRLQMWKLAPELIQEKPLLGHGQEQQKLLKEKLEYGEISSLLFKSASRNYHNQILNTMVKSGVIGLILTLSILLYPLMMIKNLPPIERSITIGLVSLFFIAGLTDVPFNHPQPLMLYLLFLVPICSKCKRVTND